MRQYNNITIQQSILDTLKYFSFFNFPPNLEEIHGFLKKKSSKRQITAILEKMCKQGIVTINNKIQDTRNKRKTKINIQISNKKLINNPLIHNSLIPLINNSKNGRYTLVEYPKASSKAKNLINETVKQWNNRRQISLNKLTSRKFQIYLRLLKVIPAIKLVGLSGSVAMFNAEEDHDLDLFIITARNRLWTGRFISILLAKLLGIHRSRHSGATEQSEGAIESNDRLIQTKILSSPQNTRLLQDDKNNETMQQFSNQYKDKVCLNLFFDQSDLAVPEFKRTDYVAHEVLQMKTLVQKDSTYLSFIDANRWVFDIFPNALSVFSMKYKVSSIKSRKNEDSIPNTKYLILDTIFNKIEKLLKSFQLHNIKKHRTIEIVTASQLWFHPDDFEKKLKINN